MVKNKVRGYRNMLGLTQAQMAKKLGMATSTYNHKEQGKGSFSDNEKLLVKEMLLPSYPTITIDEIFF